MVFAKFKQAFDSAVEKFNKVWPFAKQKLEFSEAMKNKLLKIAYLIIEVLEEVETEIEESQEEIEDIIEEE